METHIKKHMKCIECVLRLNDLMDSTIDQSDLFIYETDGEFSTISFGSLCLWESILKTITDDELESNAILEEVISAYNNFLNELPKNLDASSLK